MPESLIDLAGLRVGAEEFLATVLETTAQPFWVVDNDGVIRFANPAAISALGYERADELAGRKSHATIHHRHTDETSFPDEECPLLRPLATGEKVSSELDWFVRRDGSMFPVSYVSVPLEMPDGRGAVVAFTDIEDRLREDRQLRQRDDALEEQRASLLRVAALGAGGAASAEVFSAIAREVAQVLGVSLVELSRYEPDGSATVVGAWGDRPQPFEPGTNWPLEGATVSGLVRETRRPARIEAYGDSPGTIADAARRVGIRAAAGAPIILDGHVWGAMAVCGWEPLPDHIEDRLVEFTALLNAAFSNTASREALARLGDEQAALRRVATLVARGVSPPDLFAAVAREVGLLIGGDATHVGRYEADGSASLIASWSRTGGHVPVGTVAPIDGENVCSLVLRTGRPARMNSYDDASGPIADMLRELGVRSSVGAPIVVDRRLWGVMIVSSTGDQQLPVETEWRIAAFTELVATAISNAEARSETTRLAEEQAALRRVATLVAQGVASSELFGAVAEEVGRLFGAQLAGMIRYVTEDTITAVATWAADGEHPEVTGVWPLEGDRLATTILKTGRPAREDDWADVPGPVAAFVRERLGIRSSIGSPIVVEGRVWGALFAHSTTDQPQPRAMESRLASFTELVGTAMSNAQARADAALLADEQAALRRVATLVAQGVSAAELFGAVSEEVGRLLGADAAATIRYEPGDVVTAVGNWTAEGVDADTEVGRQWPLAGESLAPRILRTGQPARIDDWGDVPGPIAEYVREQLGLSSSVGSPILVEGRVWGNLAVHSTKGPLARDTESRIARFTELVATAILNAQARADVQRLADEQAALRRVATLVAREGQPAEVFAAVAEEVGRLLPIENTAMLRYEDDGSATVVASWGEVADVLLIGTRMPVEGMNVTAMVLRTGRPARVDDYAAATGPLGIHMRKLGIGSAVGCPIVVEGGLWGTMVAAQGRPEPLPADTEARVAQFTGLVATAISNIEARAAVAASRARIVGATDEERRRVVRDLHDGAQQRLVHTIVTLKLARRALQAGEEAAPDLVAEALAQAEEANVELRELTQGILPAVLTRGGLRSGVEALASRMPVPVDIDVSVGRLPATVEATAYFVVAEALTNVAKHAYARTAAVDTRIEDGTLRVAVRDDGVGGARPDGSGLLGLRDRLSVLDGQLYIESPADGGTLVAADIPLPA